MSTRAKMFLSAGLLAPVLAVALIGCHRPQGALIPYSGGSHTYLSTTTRPQSVQLLDVRTNEVVFSMDIPVGKQLTFEFVDGKGDDTVYRPDLMRFEVWPIGTTTGKLRNALTVPDAASRRIDLTLRPAPEYAAAAATDALRTDQVGDRPAWWTAEGGPLPADPKGVSNYDD